MHRYVKENFVIVTAVFITVFLVVMMLTSGNEAHAKQAAEKAPLPVAPPAALNIMKPCMIQPPGFDMYINAAYITSIQPVDILVDSLKGVLGGTTVPGIAYTVGNSTFHIRTLNYKQDAQKVLKLIQACNT